METVPLSADYSANIWCNVSKHTFGSLLNLLWCTQLLNLGTHMSVRRENKLNPSAALLTDRYYWITTNHYPRGYVYMSELLSLIQFHVDYCLNEKQGTVNYCDKYWLRQFFFCLESEICYHSVLKFLMIFGWQKSHLMWGLNVCTLYKVLTH